MRRQVAREKNCKMNYPNAQLEDVLAVCDSGEWGSDSLDGHGIPVLRVADIKAGNRISFATAPLRALTEEKRTSKTVKNGDILVVKSSGSGTSVVSGRAAQVWGIEDGVVGFANFLLRLRANEEKCISKYLLYVLNSPLVREQVLAIVGATTYPNLSVPAYRRIRFPLPLVAEQRRIVGLLDQAENLRSLRQQADRRTTDLIPALFNDLFAKGEYPQVSLTSVCASSDDIRCGPFGSQLLRSEFQQRGVPLWGIRNVNTGFTLQTHEFLTPSKAAELAHYSLMSGDVVMTRKGTVGNCAIYPKDFQPGIMHSDLLRIRPNFEICDPTFLTECLHESAHAVRQINDASSGAIMAGVNVGKLKKMLIPLPPLPLQKQFAAAVTDIRAMQDRQATAKNRLDDLFHSLLHRALRGEL